MSVAAVACTRTHAADSRAERLAFRRSSRPARAVRCGAGKSGTPLRDRVARGALALRLVVLQILVAREADGPTPRGFGSPGFRMTAGAGARHVDTVGGMVSCIDLDVARRTPGIEFVVLQVTGGALGPVRREGRLTLVALRACQLGVLTMVEREVPLRRVAHREVEEARHGTRTAHRRLVVTVGTVAGLPGPGRIVVAGLTLRRRANRQPAMCLLRDVALRALQGGVLAMIEGGKPLLAGRRSGRETVERDADAEHDDRTDPSPPQLVGHRSTRLPSSSSRRGLAPSAGVSGSCGPSAEARPEPTGP